MSTLGKRFLRLPLTLTSLVSPERNYPAPADERATWLGLNVALPKFWRSGAKALLGAILVTTLALPGCSGSFRASDFIPGSGPKTFGEPKKPGERYSDMDLKIKTLGLAPDGSRLAFGFTVPPERRPQIAEYEIRTGAIKVLPLPKDSGWFKPFYHPTDPNILGVISSCYESCRGKRTTMEEGEHIALFNRSTGALRVLTSRMRKHHNAIFSETGHQVHYQVHELTYKSKGKYRKGRSNYEFLDITSGKVKGADLYYVPQKTNLVYTFGLKAVSSGNVIFQASEDLFTTGDRNICLITKYMTASGSIGYVDDGSKDLCFWGVVWGDYSNIRDTVS
ncbi:MAG: hypothetical protein HOH65_03850 [Rhodospirillaceae bacterium]|nr:hypothetical protein [Rhodospirillaceae bacterium]